MIKKYKRKPIEVEAVQYFRNNINEIEDFIGEQLLRLDRDDGVYLGISLYPKGMSVIAIGDFLVKESTDEFVPYKPDVFRNIFEEV